MGIFYYCSWILLELVDIFVIEEVEVGFGDGCFKIISLGVIFEVEVLDCFFRVVSGRRKNKRFKYKIFRISRGEMLIKKWGEEV